jgi:hypothetical protein
MRRVPGLALKRYGESSWSISELPMCVLCVKLKYDLRTKGDFIGYILLMVSNCSS